jgi:hypothetical protein
MACPLDHAQLRRLPRSAGVDHYVGDPIEQVDRLIAERDEARAAAKAERELRIEADDLLLSAIGEAVGFRRERDELRDALAAALKADAVQAGYASGWDDARRSLQATIENGEAEDWSEHILQPLRDVFEGMARDESWMDLGQWLDLVWKQAIGDRDAAWTALNALGIDPRHPDAGVAKVRAVLEAAKAWRAAQSDMFTDVDKSGGVRSAVLYAAAEDTWDYTIGLIASVDALPTPTEASR